MKYNLICIVLLFLIGGCNDQDSDNNMLSDLSSLYGKNFLMKVDRIIKSSQIPFPSNELDDANYIVYHNEKIYTVSFSVDGNGVTIEPGTIHGEKTNTGTTTKVYYELSEGLFAGGRFVVWTRKDKYQAELTIYGSGVPIILSERGDLVPE